MPQGPFLREYGTEAIIPFVLFEVDGVDFRSDATPATADASVMIDEGAEASATNIYVDEGVGYSLTLTATEMLGARIVVYMVDAATKAFLDDSLIIETYGSASAMHPFPFGTATVTVGANNDKTGYSISGSKTTLDALTDGSGVTVTTNNDKTAYSIGGVKTNLDALTDGSGVTVTTNNDKTGYAVSTVSDKTGYSISGTKQTLDALTDGSGVTVATNSDKTGYSISGSKQTLDALTDGSGVTVTTNNDKTGYSISGSLNTFDDMENLSAGTIASSVWGALIASYDVNDTFGNVINDLTEDSGGTHRFTQAALAQGPSGGASATTIANAVWNAFGSSHTTSGTFGVDAISLSADTIWDEVVDGTTTARESFVISNTILAGKVSGGSSTTATFRDLADSKDRIVVVFTVDGDKTSVTFSDIAA